MAPFSRYRVLKQGVAVWNAWRDKNPDIRPDLSAALHIEASGKRTLSDRANLSAANLSGVDLWRADLSGANLSGPT